jgi:exonuclease SbcC
MRPVRLEIQGFTCYREKQDIDFSRLGLFAIAGPTGAGKSSILDAIAFALYGKIPRLGGQNLDEFISLGAARASVLFEFDIQNERFRVARSMPRAGPKKAQLEQISNGSRKALADGVGEVNAKLEALLGLAYEAFIQSVLLPQGQFAKFLQSKPSDQRQILRELLRLGVYERMRERAFSQAKELSNAIEADRKFLEGPYAEATPQNVAQIESEVNALRGEREAALQTRDQLRQSFLVLQEQWKLIEERKVRRGFLQKLEQDRPRIENLKNSIARAKQAAQALPALDLATRKANECGTVGDEVENLDRELGLAKKAAANCEQKLSEAQTRADAVPAKRSRLLALTGIQPVMQERKELTARIKKLRTALAETEKELTDEKSRLEQATAAAHHSREMLESLRKQRADLGYDATIHQTFKKAERPAYDLAEARKLLESLDPEAVATSVQEANVALSKAEEEFKSAEAEHAAEEERAKAAQVAMEAAQDQHKAASLRSGLVPGCMCPVCNQPVNDLPPVETPTDVAVAKGLAAQLKKSSKAAADRANGARDRLGSARARAENAQKNAADFENTVERYRGRMHRCAEALADAIKPFECPPGLLLDQFVEQELTRQERLHSIWWDAGEKVNQAELAAQKADSRRDQTMATVETHENAKVRINAEILEGDGRLARYDAQITVIGSDDPERELSSLQKEVDDIDRQNKDAADRHREAARIAQEKEIKTSEARARLSSAIQQRDEARTIADSALRSAGFANEAEARKASMGDQAIIAAEKEVATFDKDISQTNARIAELDAELEGVTLSEAELRSVREAASKAEAEVIELAGKIGQRSEKLERLRAETEKAETLRLEHEKRRCRHALVQRLSQDLKSDGFQQYLLDGSFRRLVAGASSRLRDLNDRYELSFSDGKFAVIDHDHGSLSRLADTLSGGETFLVSLALALELSEQVQKAAGAVRLDSLFIDEGFGTLDPETLDTVADAIESLSKTNRMVGVITHVAELHRRLPRLEVRPTPAGSVVQYVED